jgi:phytoene dehydrogenase-like protein
VFFNDSDRFHWERPRDELCDIRSGVICSPNNYLYGDEDFPEGFIRVTLMADHDRWRALPEDEYRLAKLRWCDRTAASSVRFMPDYRQHVVDTDMFTPRTIHRFTWHDNGAVYGAPDKKLDGTTSIDHLFLCGSDQGFVGIVGAILSGITVANQHLLRDGP